ncbi:MAG: type II toxin-antitoxin system RelE/ParE family toxin [Rhizobiaceae bacterium]|nr:type II toxin-antitoxin system RelE/ParE family toxin [Rhizobiaceae bacterium]
MTWIVETLNATVDAELEALPADQIAKFIHIGELIQVLGLDRVRQPHVKHLQGPLWGIRMKGRDGISRALYEVVKTKRLVVVRVFAKKSQKTPRREIELALKRAEDMI